MQITFNTNNDTQKYLLIVNNHAQLFDSKQDAMALYDSVDVESDYVGSCEIVPPGLHQEHREHYASDLQMIDLADYMVKRKKRCDRDFDFKMLAKKPSLGDRLDSYKFKKLDKGGRGFLAYLINEDITA